MTMTVIPDINGDERAGEEAMVRLEFNNATIILYTVNNVTMICMTTMSYI